tara:strand:- start:366 stop:638 length:273 start_codon:yes stop_codon:yes gene_type:complete
MTNSINKALTGVIALALVVIAVCRIPFSREKELSNLCREYYTMNLNEDYYSSKEIETKIQLIAKKTSLNAKKNNILDFCNSFYFNQRQIE